MKFYKIYAVSFFMATLLLSPASAAVGEMGIGIPHFGSYSATGIQTIVWSIENSQLPFPTGCTSLTLTAATMGMDAYKIAIATLLTARAGNLPVRFYSHAERDNGCGVDYVAIQ